MNNPGRADSAVRVDCEAAPSFQAWLAQAGGSLVVSTYQAGKVALIGWDGRRVTLLLRQFDKPLGIAVSGARLALATRNDLCLLADAPLLAPDFVELQPGRYDALYLPRVTYHTGDLSVHDVALVGDELVLVATRFSCLARLSLDFNFSPLWRPRFVSDLVPEDRCHLNGLAIVDGRPKYVTALGATDTAGGWREGKATGGVLVDVQSDEVLLRGLAMPHSPRWHDGRLWLLNSGAGQLLTVNPANGQHEVVCELPGYLRGLCFVGTFAVVGLSKIREKHVFGGLPVQNRCANLQCGVAVIDTRSGTLAGMFEFTSGCEELYDVQFLPGVCRPMILNQEKPEVLQAVSNPESSFWLRAAAGQERAAESGGVMPAHAWAAQAAAGVQPAGER